MAVVLYKYNGSAPSRAVLMTLDILKINIVTRDINPLVDENLKPEYIKKNHLHTVPILEEGDFILADSHVIMTYLVQTFRPDCELYPKDLKIRSTIDQRMYLESTILTPKIITAVERLKKYSDLSKELIAALENSYGFFDKYLEKTKFLATDYLTLADVSCVSSLATLNLIHPIGAQFPKLLDWFNRLKKEDWFVKINEPGVKKFEEECLNQLRKDL